MTREHNLTLQNNFQQMDSPSPSLLLYSLQFCPAFAQQQHTGQGDKGVLNKVVEVEVRK